MQIGSKVKKIRELRDFTQNYLADYLGITQSTYSRYEKDELHFSEEMLEKLSQLLGLSVAAIEQFDEEKLFLHIEHFGNNMENKSHREIRLTEQLINELQKDNDFLRNSIEDLRQIIPWLKKD